MFSPPAPSKTRSAAGKCKASFPCSRGARGLSLGFAGIFPKKKKKYAPGSPLKLRCGHQGCRGKPGAAGPARPGSNCPRRAAALPFDVTVPTMVLAPRAAAWTAKERAGGCGPEAGWEPEREPARGAGRDHAGARGSREKRRSESARRSGR